MTASKSPAKRCSQFVLLGLATLTITVGGCATRTEPASPSVSIKDAQDSVRPKAVPRPATSRSTPKPKVVKAKPAPKIAATKPAATAQPDRATPPPVDMAPAPLAPKKPAGVATPASKATIPAGADCQTAEACEAIVQMLVASPDRSWIGVPSTAGQYATGVRLSAFDRLRPSLTCQELVLAADEIATMNIAFQKPVEGVAADTANRTRALGARIEKELKAEIKARC